MTIRFESVYFESDFWKNFNICIVTAPVELKQQTQFDLLSTKYKK